MVCFWRGMLWSTHCWFDRCMMFSREWLLPDCFASTLRACCKFFASLNLPLVCDDQPLTLPNETWHIRVCMSETVQQANVDFDTSHSDNC